MRKISASIDITSKSHTLAELSLMAGVDEGSASHDKGTSRGRRGICTESILRIDSHAPADSPVDVHLDDLLHRFKSLGLKTGIMQDRSVRAYINLGIIFTSADMSFAIEPSQLLALAQNNLGLDVSAYPAREDGGD